jgi:hypothetical protein
MAIGRNGREKKSSGQLIEKKSTFDFHFLFHRLFKKYSSNHPMIQSSLSIIYNKYKKIIKKMNYYWNEVNMNLKGN